GDNAELGDPVGGTVEGGGRTSEDQLYSGPVTLRTSLGNTRLEGRDITFSGAGSSINQAGSSPAQLQLVSSRNVRLEGAVGNSGPLGSLAVSATSQISLAGES
ncbi:MAG: hypothetical protein ACKOJF_16940, partial [Planctomycetaceae bacterium]